MTTNPTPQLTGAQCRKIIGATLSGLILLTDTATVRQALRFWEGNDAAWAVYESLAKNAEKAAAQAAPIPTEHAVNLVEMMAAYVPTSLNELRIRTERAVLATGIKYKHLPGNPDPESFAGMLSGGRRVTAKTVEAFYNEAQLFDFIGDHGKYGPLYKDVHNDHYTLEILELAEKLYGA